ncbi:MAG TPA: histidine kinase dimerization/phospho-acceptor domain-containing protein [Gemmatimonadota bacterium]|nr:histidine kinase dimerization/phospho-acceptor domain-containing protein [Gemmatimonadota bacterium]
MSRENSRRAARPAVSEGAWRGLVANGDETLAVALSRNGDPGNDSEATTQSLLGVLAACVADEVRNPLTAILGYIDVAERRVGDEGAEWMRGMRDEVRRIDRVIRELGRLAAGPTDLVCGLDLNEMVRQVLRDAMDEEAHPLSLVDVELDLGEGVPEVEGDPLELEALVRRVLTEAARTASPASAPAGRLVLTTEPADGDDAARLRVVAEGARRASGGNLTLARWRIVDLGGSVDVSRPSASTTLYTITLPARTSGDTDASRDGSDGAGERRVPTC